MKTVEYVEKPQNRFWKFCWKLSAIAAIFSYGALSAIAPEGLAVLFEQPAATFKFVGLFALPPLIIGFLAKA